MSNNLATDVFCGDDKKTGILAVTTGDKSDDEVHMAETTPQHDRIVKNAWVGCDTILDEFFRIGYNFAPEII